MYPAVAAAEALRQQHRGVELIFVGSAGGFERPLLEEANFRFDQIAAVRAGPLHGVNPLRAVLSLANLAFGTAQALRLLRRYTPRAVLLTGGWVGLPVAWAAWLRRVPSLIYLPDIEPGLAIRALQRYAARVAVTAADSAQFFPPGKIVVTGYPVREALRAAASQAGREAALDYFGLDPARKTVLVFGGSRGARSINHALIAIVPELLADGVQVLHLTGTLDWETIAAQRAAMAGADGYHVFPYLHEEMALALAAADLAVCRAGASTLGELPLFGLPAVLVPYPHAWRYQKVNAEWLAQQGAGVVLEDAALTTDLLPLLRALLGDPARLAAMRERSAALAQPRGAANLADELLRLAGENV